MPAILDFDFARPASYDPTDMVGVACVRSLAAGAHPGTYVGQDGLIKLAPHNYVLYSEQFNNGGWNKRGTTTVTADATTDPNGALNADLVQGLGAGSGTTQGLDSNFSMGAASAAVSVGFWVKKVTSSGTLKVYNVADNTRGEWSVDLSALSGGWERITKNHPAVTEVIAWTSSVSSTAGFQWKAASGTLSFYLWGAQLNLGPTALDYVKTTSAANGGTRIGWGPREPYQNLLLQTTLPGGGSAPTGWTQDVGTGTSVPVSSKYGSAATAYAFSATAQRPMIGQSPTLVANTTYSYSARVEAVSGVNFDDVISVTGLPSGCAYVQRYINGIAVAAFAAIAPGDLLCIVIGGTYSSGTGRFRFGIGCNGNATGSVTMSRPNLNVGSQAYNWYPTTSAPVYATPFDLVGNWECHGGMSEGLRQNLAVYSEQFDDAAWTKASCTVTANATTSPDGTSSADTLNSTVSGGRAVGFVVATATSSHVFSVFIKAGTSASVTILLRNNTTATNIAEASFSTSTGASSAVVAGAAIEGVDIGNGWWRVAVVSSGGVTAGNSLAFYVYPGTSSGTGSSYAWGAQLEAGSYPTSYIPTTTVAVARGADLLTTTLSAAHAAALSVAGTLVARFSFLGGDSTADNNSRTVAQIDGAANNYHRINNRSSSVGSRTFTASAEEYGQATGGTAATNTPVIAAYAFQTDDCRLARAGSLATADVAPSAMPAVTSLTVGASSSGSAPFGGLIHSIAVYTSRLTDAQLQALTA